MGKHCEPFVRVETGWRIDYNPCRHFNTLYITLDTKEILFNGVIYNKFDVQDISFKNGTLYINIGNRLLSCKIPVASKECYGLMSPLDKQQLDYIFQLLEDGIDGINISKNKSWGVGLIKNDDKQIQPEVTPITTFEELMNLQDDDEKLISAKLLKQLIEYNHLKQNPEETFTVTLYINDLKVDQKNIVSGENYSYIYSNLSNGYQLTLVNGQNVIINGNNITLTNVRQNTDINLRTIPINYTISYNGYDGQAWTNNEFPTSYSIESTSFDIVFTLNSGYKNGQVTYKIGNGPVQNVQPVNNVYTINVPKGTYGNIIITLSASAIEPVNPTLSISMGSWTYGEMAPAPRISTNSDGERTVVYKKENSPDSEYTEEKPVNAGNYVVKVTVSATTNYNESSAIANFIIHRAASILEVNNPESTAIANGESTTIEVTSNTPGNLTLTTSSGEGWNATSSSASTTHTITVNNLSEITTAGTIAAGGIKATFTPTDTTNYTTLNNQNVLNQDITLEAEVLQPRAWLDSTELKMTRGDLDSIQWTSTGVTPNETTSGTFVTLDKGTVTGYHNYNDATTTLHLENISNPRLDYSGYSSYISVGEIQNNQATVSVSKAGIQQIARRECKIKVYDGSTLVTTLTLHVQRDPGNQTITGATYTQYVGNVNKGDITFSDGVKFQALDVENYNTTVTIKVSYGGKTATNTVTYTVNPARTYYWYVGYDQDAFDNTEGFKSKMFTTQSNSIPSTWTKASGNKYTLTGETPNYLIAVIPTNMSGWNVNTTMQNPAGGVLALGLEKSNITIDGISGVTFNVYSTASEATIREIFIN